ncbi:hypothetical protein [Undibacterium sp. WLHG33]
MTAIKNVVPVGVLSYNSGSIVVQESRWCWITYRMAQISLV